MNPTSKIDMHTHLVTAATPFCFSAEERLAFDKAMNIGKSVLLPAAVDPKLSADQLDEWDKIGLQSEDARALAQQYPDHFAWMCNVYLDGTDAPFEQLKRYKAMGACGVGEFTQTLRLDDPRMEQLFDWCGQLNLPFLFHISPSGQSYGVVDLPGLPLLEGALKKFPHTRFIGHSQPFWFEMSEYPADLTDEERNAYPAGKVVPGRVPYLLEKYDNLYGDLSADSGGNAILRDADYGIEFLNRFQDKLMYGSDTISCELHYPLGAYLDSLHHQGKLSDEAYTKIIRGNAERILGL